MLNFFKNKKVIDYFSLISIFTILFLWGFTYNLPKPFFIQVRLILLPLIFFLLFAFFSFFFNYKEITTKFYLVFLLIILHKLFGDFYTENFVKRDYLMLGFFLSTVIFCNFKKDLIYQNLN